MMTQSRDTAAAYVKRLDVAVEFLNVLVVLASQLVLLQAKHNYTLQTRHDNIIRSASVEIRVVHYCLKVPSQTNLPIEPILEGVDFYKNKLKQCCYPPAISIYK